MSFTRLPDYPTDEQINQANMNQINEYLARTDPNKAYQNNLNEIRRYTGNKIDPEKAKNCILYGYLPPDVFGKGSDAVKTQIKNLVDNSLSSVDNSLVENSLTNSSVVKRVNLSEDQLQKLQDDEEKRELANLSRARRVRKLTPNEQARLLMLQGKHLKINELFLDNYLKVYYFNGVVAE